MKARLVLLGLTIMFVTILACSFAQDVVTPEQRLPTLQPTSPSISLPSTEPATLTIIVDPTADQQPPTMAAADGQADQSTVVSQPTEGLQQEPTAALTTCTPPNGRDNWGLYIVQVGDTLFSLEQRTGTSVSEIQLANCLVGSVIVAGEPLYLPSIPVPPFTHTPTPSLSPTVSATVDQTITVTPSNTPTPLPPTETPTPTNTVSTPVPPGPGDPTATVTPKSGPPGTQFTIQIDNFEADEPITIRIIYVPTFKIVFQKDAKVDNRGNLVDYYPSPNDALVGDYIVDVSGTSSAASGEFKITSPPVTTQPLLASPP